MRSNRNTNVERPVGRPVGRPSQAVHSKKFATFRHPFPSLFNNTPECPFPTTRAIATIPSQKNARAFSGDSVRGQVLPSFLGLLVLCICTCICGCSDGNPFSQVQVTGTVLYDDGSVIPVSGLKLWFECQEGPKDGGRAFPRPASAPVNVSDGTFSTATTVRYGDGLIRGKHKVSLDLTPAIEGPAQPVPLEYTAAATTPLVIDTAKLPLEIRVPRPSAKK